MLTCRKLIAGASACVKQKQVKVHFPKKIKNNSFSVPDFSRKNDGVGTTL